MPALPARPAGPEDSPSSPGRRRRTRAFPAIALALLLLLPSAALAALANGPVPPGAVRSGSGGAMPSEGTAAVRASAAAWSPASGRPSPGAPHVRMTTVALPRSGAPAYLSQTPSWLAYDPNDASFWIAGGSFPNVVVVAASNTSAVSATLWAGKDPFAVAVDNFTDEVFVTNSGSGNVTIISDTDNGHVGAFGVGVDPTGIAVDAAAGEVFVANSASANVSVYSIAAGAVIANVPVGYDPLGVAYDPATNQVFVVDSESYAVSVISPATDQVVTTIPVGITPYGVAVDNATDTVYVTNAGSNNLTIIDPTTDTVTGSIPIAIQADLLSLGYASLTGIAYDSRTGELWVGGGLSYLILVNTTTASVSAYITEDPAGLAWDAAAGIMCVTNTYNTTLACFTQPPTFGAASPRTVNEAGLPTGTRWNITEGNGTTWSSTGASQTLSLDFTGFNPNRFAIPPVDGYVATPAYIQFNATAHPTPINVTFAKATSLDRLNFLESGLPLGMGWSVDFSTRVLGTTGSAVSTELTNGLYFYTVLPIPGFAPVPQQGELNVSAASVNITITFAGYAYSVPMTESGLPNGTAWYLNETAGPSGAPVIDTGAIYSWIEDLSLVNGSYTFSIATTDKQLHSSGSVSLSENGGTVTPLAAESIVFAAYTANVTFQESGLPTGSIWSVTLGGTLNATNGTTLGFVEPNGTYAYSVSPPAGWGASPASGNVTVSGSNPAPIGLTFNSTYPWPISFNASGLPNGTGWAVSIGSQLASGTGNVINLYEPNGTYDYVILDVPGFTTRYSGSVLVHGHGVLVNVAFTPETYPVVVVEFGLPVGTTWSANVSEVGRSFYDNQSTNGSAILFFLPNGTFTLSVTVPAGYSANVTGATFTVDGSVAKSPSVGYTSTSPGTTVPPAKSAHTNTTASSTPLWPYLVGIGLAAVAVIAVLAVARRRPPSEGPDSWPEGPLPPDRSVAPPAEGTDRPREPPRGNGGSPPAPLEDAF